MEITTIYDDGQTCVKMVKCQDQLLYTRTYIFDDEGFVEKSITVHRDGTVTVQ